MTRDDEVFADAAALPARERAAFLEKACADDAPLRARVEALLRGHEAANGFLKAPLAMRAAAAAAAPEEGAGTRIGLSAVGSAM